MKSVFRRANAPAKQQRRPGLEMDDRRAVHRAGRVAEKRHEHVGGVLIGQQGDDLVLLQALQHGAGRVSPREDMRPVAFPRIDEQLLGVRVVGFPRHDVKRVAVGSQPAGHELPVAEVAGNEQRALARGERLTQILLTFYGRQAIHVGTAQLRNLDELSAPFPEMPEDRPRYALPLAAIRIPAVDQFQVFQRHLPALSQHIIYSPPSARPTALAIGRGIARTGPTSSSAIREARRSNRFRNGSEAVSSSLWDALNSDISCVYYALQSGEMAPCSFVAVRLRGLPHQNLPLCLRRRGRADTKRRCEAPSYAEQGPWSVRG